MSPPAIVLLPVARTDTYAAERRTVEKKHPWEYHLVGMKDIDEALERLQTFIGRKAPDRIFAAFPVESDALNRFRQEAVHENGYPDPAERVTFWADHLAQCDDVRDDTVPAAYLSEFDQGLYGGLCGGLSILPMI